MICWVLSGMDDKFGAEDSTSDVTSDATKDGCALGMDDIIGIRDGCALGIEDGCARNKTDG